MRRLLAFGAVLPSVFSPAPAQETSASGTTPSASATPQVRTLCPNYVKALSESVYPRDAIHRKIDAGEAVVDFVVDHGRPGQIVVVSESDRAFGTVAASAIARLECERLDEPVHFRLPFKFRRETVVPGAASGSPSTESPR